MKDNEKGAFSFFKTKTKVKKGEMMLSLSGVNAGQAANYYEKDDYYFNREADGKGEVVLGDRPGERIEREEFLRLVFERIGKNQKEPKGNDRVADDLTFSAPKSVSLIAALGSPEQREQIIEAHREAVKAVMDYIENSRMIQARDQFGNPSAAYGATAVRFDHFANRNGDPQLHSHVLVANAVYRAEDGKLVSAYLREIYTNKKALGAMYRLELANRLEKLGYEAEWRKDGTFEVKGFTEEQLKAFSSRRAEIEKALEEKGVFRGKGCGSGG